jgi:ABC-type dipeptide/oligopeptide/nickel transport system permease component
VGRYLVFRTTSILGTLLVISFFVFVVMHAIPGGPFDEDKMPLPPARKANILRSYGLDRPLSEQYVRFVWNVAHLNFGVSYQSPGESVLHVLSRVWPVTMHLGGMALAIALAGGLFLGVTAALRQNTATDYLTTGVAVFGLVVPHFVLGSLLILVFSTFLGWLPAGGWEGPRQWLLPTLTYCLAPLGLVARYTRVSVLEVLGADHVRTARAKGLATRRVVMRHVLRNARVPLVTVIGPLFPDLLTGSIFVEGIYRVPGLGRYFVTSVYDRDYPMIMGLAILAALLVSVMYLLSDILYLLADPRIRYT